MIFNKRPCFPYFISGVFITSFAFMASAQNLVLNPSFEDYNKEAFSQTCKFIFQDTADVKNWYSTGNTSAKKAHRCQSKSMYLSPSKLGIQPHEGKWMIGFTAIRFPKGNNSREYLVGHLREPLKANSSYIISFYLSPRNGCEQGAGEIGIWLTTTSPHASDSFNQDFRIQPQLTFHKDNIIEKGQWQKLETTFTAVGGEWYLVIGNFKNDEESVAVPFGANTKKMEYWEQYFTGFYFIDDISITEIKTKQPGTLYQRIK